MADNGVDLAGRGDINSDCAYGTRYLTLLDELSNSASFAILFPTNGATPPLRHIHEPLEHALPFLHRANNDGADIFVVVNETNLEGAKDADVVRIRAVFADDDQKRETYRIDWPLEPHLIIESSPGRYHYYWLVDGLAVAEFKLVQQAIAKQYGTDPSITNPARLMRLPGFINNKCDEDGQPKYDRFICRIVGETLVRSYTADEIRGAFLVLLPDLSGTASPILGNDEIIRSLQQGGRYVGAKGSGKHIIVCPWADQHTDGRHEAAYFEALTNGYAGPAFKCLHAHCSGRTVSDLRAYLHFPSNNPTESPSDADIQVARLNEDWAIIPLGGGKEIIKICHDADLFEPVVTFHSVASFRTFTANLPPVQRGKVLVSAALHWLEHPQRRQYEGITFDPSGRLPKNRFNLFCGFEIDPMPGSCDCFLRFTHEIICAQNDESYEYVLNWMAQIFQHPTEKPGTALVLRGHQGTGKNTFSGVLGRLIGRHYIEISDLDRLLGRFNFFLSDKLLVLANESIWGGNRSKVGSLKSFVTDTDAVFEAKGVEPIRMRHYGRLIVASNEGWAVSADIDDRRFVFLDVSDSKACDDMYFEAIWKELKNGGYEALMHALMERDISDWSPRQRPDTGFGQDVIEYSMSTDKQFWFEVLDSGELPVERSGVVEVIPYDAPAWKATPKDEVYGAYLLQCRKMGRNHAESKMAFFQTLYRLLGMTNEEDKKTFTQQKRRDGKRIRLLRLPSVESLRRDYDTVNRTNTVWKALEDED
jgi:hypothetical protein